jgi:hypothetical protein
MLSYVASKPDATLFVGSEEKVTIFPEVVYKAVVLFHLHWKWLIPLSQVLPYLAAARSSRSVILLVGLGSARAVVAHSGRCLPADVVALASAPGCPCGDWRGR